MRQNRPTIVPYSRDYRRPPRWGMGVPSRKPRRWWQRVADPLFYLRAVILLSGLALVAIPLISDGTLALLRPIPAGAQSCRVVRVIDGDTADLWCATAGLQRARLAGFDAPELFSPNCMAELIAAQKAKWALRGLLLTGGPLRLSLGGLDKYERLLVTVWVNGVPLAKVMIAGGHARKYGGEARQSWCD